MKQEHKELLLRDLCGRLPYGVKAYIKNWSKLDRKYYEGVYTVKSIYTSLNTIFADSERSCVDIIVGYDDYEIKPYLFPMSSMTDEQKMFLKQQNWCIAISTSGTVETTIEGIDWLNKNHFDYRNLINKNLAIDCTNLNIY